MPFISKEEYQSLRDDAVYGQMLREHEADRRRKERQDLFDDLRSHLKPCPVCGSRPQLVSGGGHYDNGWVAILCSFCSWESRMEPCRADEELSDTARRVARKWMPDTP